MCTRAITDTDDDDDDDEGTVTLAVTSGASSSRSVSSSFTSPDRVVRASVVYCSWLMKCIALVNPIASAISLSEYTIMAVDFDPNPSH